MKKKIGIILLIVFMILSISAFAYYIKYLSGRDEILSPGEGKGPFLAQEICMMNTDTKKIYLDKDMNEHLSPASTTKMMTAIVVMKYAYMDDIVDVGKEIYEISSDSSKAGLYEGEQLSVKDMLAAMLLPSGNDAAYVLANYTGKIIAGNDELTIGQATEVFVNEMNKEAAALGANNTVFIRPDGYDSEGQYSTAYDLALIAMNLEKDDVLSNIVSSYSWECENEKGEILHFTNTNKLLDRESEFYDPEIIGVKTGSTGHAGDCLISAKKINGQVIVLVLLGDTGNARYEDATTIWSTYNN